MRLYVAAGFDHAEAAAQLIEALRAGGHTITFDWTMYRLMVADGWSPNAEEMESIAAEEIEGVRAAQGLIVLLPGGKGTHAELGAALSLRKPTCIFGENTRATPFYLHPAVVFRGCRRSPSTMAYLAETALTNALNLLAR